MKKIIIMLFICILVSDSYLYAAGRLAPVPEGGKLASGEETNREIYVYTDKTLAEIENFIKNEFKDYAGLCMQPGTDPKVILFYDWGNSKWHSIRAVDKEKDGIELTVTRDSWTWILGTLVIRFTGVFIILVVLMIVMYISSFFFSRANLIKKDPVS